jgi:hypothetical protein
MKLSRPPFGELVAQAGGEDFVWPLITEGQTAKQIAALFGCSRDQFNRWARESPERWTAYQEAKRESAHALAEEGAEILDKCPAETTAQVTLAKARADFRLRMAAVRSPDYRENLRVDAQVTHEIGETLASVLRERAHARAGRLGPTFHAREVLPAEIVEDD